MIKILVIGSGWGSSNFIKNINTNKYEISVVSPTKDFTYTPLLANNIKNNTNLTVDVSNLNKINYIEDCVNDIKVNENIIITKNNKEYKYDYLIFAHGADINTFGIEGVKENCYCIKTSDDANYIRNKLNKLPNNSKIAVIGCGLTGSEIIGNLIDYKKFNIYAIDGLNRPLISFSPKTSKFTSNLWKNNGVNLRMNRFVSKVDNNSIYFKDNKINYDLALWCGGIKISPLSILINNVLNLNCNFGIPVNKYLKVENTKNVYAIGDCAYSGNPPTAQVASQQGKYLANYFNNNFEGNEFKFKSKGQICYVGDGNSVYQNGNLMFKGKLTGYLNSFVHLYNSINIKQLINFIRN